MIKLDKLLELCNFNAHKENFMDAFKYLFLHYGPYFDSVASEVTVIYDNVITKLPKKDPRTELYYE